MMGEFRRAWRKFWDEVYVATGVTFVVEWISKRLGVKEPKWSVDYHGEWPDPLFCFLRSILTLHFTDGHRWVDEWDDEPFTSGPNAFESQACSRCGAVRGRGGLRMILDDIGGEPTTADRAAVRKWFDSPAVKAVIVAPPHRSFACPDCGHKITTFANRPRVGCGGCGATWTIREQKFTEREG